MNYIPAEILRIIDANINRTGEGLRVLEEFARLSLNNAVFSQRLKNLRHKILHVDIEFQKLLLQARDAGADVGSVMDVPGELKVRSTAETIIANSHRVQESLRVLEELAKTPGIPLNSDDFRRGRFEIYTLEKELLGTLSRKDKIDKIKGLYVVIDSEWLRGRKPEDVALTVIEGGAEVIQLRWKKGGVRDFITAAVKTKEVCSVKGVPFIVNDSLEVALACRADGLHIGQDDIPAGIARQLMPIHMVLGVSARTVEEARLASENGADYLGVGAVFSTGTKDSSVIGLENLKNIIKNTLLPVVAIGGINNSNIKSVMDAGSVSAAVISAVLGAEDIKKAAVQLVGIIRGQKNE